MVDVPVLAGFECRRLDDHTLEVAVDKEGKSINQLFFALSEQGVEIRSMRNKANRLEELFVNLVKAA